MTILICQQSKIPDKFSLSMIYDGISVNLKYTYVVMITNSFQHVTVLRDVKYHLPQISVHDEANNENAKKCIFPFVDISYPQDNH